jgi:hypothetical protein
MFDVQFVYCPSQPGSFICSYIRDVWEQSFDLAPSTLSFMPAETRNPYPDQLFSSIFSYTRLAIATAALAAGMPA